MDRMTRGLLWCGAVGAPLFISVFLVAGATRADYDPLRHPVSSLALGPGGWVQTVNFLVTGALMLAFGFGLRRALSGVWLPLLIGLFAIGLIGAGVFVTDPLGGYPPGSPQELKYTTVGILHDAFSVLVFLGLPIAFIVAAVRKIWPLYSIATAVLFLAGFFLASAGFSQDPDLMPIGGLLQRLTIGLGFAWLTTLALRLLLSGRAGRDQLGQPVA